MMKDSSRFKDGIKGDASATKVVRQSDAAETPGGTDSRRWAWPDDRGQYDWMDHFSPPGNSWW